jgi:hypothetical protein
MCPHVSSSTFLQLVLQCPLLLTWPPHQLHTRLTNMAAQLGISSSSLAALLQQHPQLLPASSHLRRTLLLLQQLFLLAASSEQAGFGTGVVSALTAAAEHSAAQRGWGGGGPSSLQQQQPGGQQPHQQQQQGERRGGGVSAEAAAVAAARAFAVAHPQVLLVAPEALHAQVATMQATSGLSAAQVAAMLISQPALLLQGQAVVAGSNDVWGAVGGRGRRQNARPRQSGSTRQM